jgi:integrase
MVKQGIAVADWVLEPDKFLSLEEAKKLLGVTKQRAERALLRKQKIAVRDYFIIDLALSTGLRVMEIARLKCGDLFIGNGNPCLVVRKGKGGRKRIVKFSDAFACHCTEYLHWKETIGELTLPLAPLLTSSMTGKHLTTRAIQKAFKRSAARAGMSTHYSIHSLRHTFACQLYRASSYNLRLVQKQLGHASIRTTEVYADVMEPDVECALERLYE